jgi:hypothetical protein
MPSLLHGRNQDRAAQALNLACSGAKTATSWDVSGHFKPGRDFYSDGAGNIG